MDIINEASTKSALLLEGMDCVKCQEWREPLAQLCTNSPTNSPQTCRTSPKLKRDTLRKNSVTIRVSNRGKSYLNHVCNSLPKDEKPENITQNTDEYLDISYLQPSTSKAELPVLKEPLQSLETAEWFWGSISRVEVNRKLTGTPDGSFLVRNSAHVPGDFTLTVRKGGRNKLIKITNNAGKYGFCAPFTFDSVVDLVDYYRTESLAQFNSTLDVKLILPIVREPSTERIPSVEEHIKLKKKLIALNNSFIKKSNTYGNYKENLNKASEELSKAQQMMKAYKATFNMFESQVSLLENSIRTAEPHEVKIFRGNLSQLQGSNSSLIKTIGELEAKIKQKQIYKNILQNNIDSLEVDIVNLDKEIDKIKETLISYGESMRSIQFLMGEFLPEKFLDDCPHTKESTWFVPDCSRIKAEKILFNKKNGTFLVRPSSCGQYALSIVSGGNVNHCRIIKTDNGYGFTKPFDIHKSLKDLVLHYYFNSLGEFNENLNITLAFPVFVKPRTKSLLETIKV